MEACACVERRVRALSPQPAVVRGAATTWRPCSGRCPSSAGAPPDRRAALHRRRCLAVQGSLTFEVLQSKKTTNVTKGGRVQSHSVFVVAGNHRGVAGFGRGKSRRSVRVAMEKAKCVVGPGWLWARVAGRLWEYVDT